ncbi:MAG: hypothetical protein R3F53_26800 [Gammaproteobacteria bacterium]
MKTNNYYIRRLNNQYIFFASLLLVSVSDSTSALMFDFLTQPLTIEPTSISITTAGVTATAAAYHVEFENGTSTIYGPFTTGYVGARQVFGTETRGASNPGLGLVTAQQLGQRETDIPSGGLQPGLDNFPSTSTNYLPSIQFVLFSFNSPVDISQVIVDDTSNFDRDSWVAGGISAPNFSLDLVQAFDHFNVINSKDNESDGIFIHTFNSLIGIKFLAVGTALPSTVGDVGLFAQGFPTGASHFYINALNFEKSNIIFSDDFE